MSVLPFQRGGYRFVEGVFQYSAGVAAEALFIEALTEAGMDSLRRVLPGLVIEHKRDLEFLRVPDLPAIDGSTRRAGDGIGR